MFDCIDAFAAAFCTLQKGDGFVRFCDDKIEDMYDHNFLLIEQGREPEACEAIIRAEIAKRRREGKSFCQVHLLPQWEPLSFL